MWEKILPIGTVCVLKNRKQEIMITSYYSSIYGDGVVTYKYKGCNYPEGVGLSNLTYSFNDSDIEQILFDGYKNENYEKFKKKVLELFSCEYGAEHIITKNSYTNIEFDDNGFVIKADKMNDVANPFVNQNTKNYQFDANGVLVSEGTEMNIISSEYDFDANGNVVTDDGYKKQLADKYEFDENGNVVMDDGYKKQLADKYEFDENGRIIGDEYSKESVNKYNFSNNSVIIDDEIIKKPSIPIYVFDSNGTVVSE